MLDYITFDKMKGWDDSTPPIYTSEILDENLKFYVGLEDIGN